MTDSKLIKAFFKGLLTYIPGVSSLLEKKKQTSKHSGSHAEFCYALWLSILVFLEENEIQPELNEIGEIGCGGSLGVGICALLTGSKKYYPLEIDVLFDKEENLKMLDELVVLLKNKTWIPEKYKQLNIKLGNYDYPGNSIKPLFLQESVIAEIKEDINNGFTNSKRIKIIKDWEKAPSLKLDFIFSRAVMEHVAAPDDIYKAIHYHLKPGSYMFHDIEYHSHGLTKRIDGHFSIPGYVWKIIYGKRQYFLNRWKSKDHLASINSKGFQIIKTKESYVIDVSNGRKTLNGEVIIAKKVNG